LGGEEERASSPLHKMDELVDARFDSLMKGFRRKEVNPEVQNKWE
jgi:hypothetical protein